MSEKIYSWLLRLYPARFRQTYGTEAMQLFRDRIRNETGIFPRLRLWFDLLVDVMVSLPREHRRRQPATLAASSAPHLDGIPSFQVLEDESPRPGALVTAAMLSLVCAVGLSGLINHGGTYRRFGAWVVRAPFQSQALAGPSTSDTPKWRRVVDGAIAKVDRYYTYPEVGQKVVESLRTHEVNGDDDRATDGAALADLLSGQMLEVSHDPNLKMVFNLVKPPDQPRGPTLEGMARYRKALKENNCFFTKIEILPHNIGYLKLDSFPDPDFCGTTATKAMASLNRVDSIIFDLRENHGGYPAMVALIAGYLFDHPTHLNDLFNRVDNSRQESWTKSPVPGNRLANKAAYVLTSPATFSGAEEFSYDMKMLKRATIVGEATSGRGHMGTPYWIDDHFEIQIRDRTAINPISKTNWDGPGVLPDVKVKAEDALETVEKLAAGERLKK